MARALRIGLYSPYLGTTLGGGERYLLSVAQALRDGYPAHELDLISPVGWDRARYEGAFGLDLGGIGVVATNRRVTWVHRLANRVGALRVLRNRVLGAQAARLTGRYDLFLAMVYRIPIRSSAARGVVLCQFPDRLGPGELDGYQLVICQSAYVRRWIEERWGRPANVIEPPVEHPAEEPDWGAKTASILSVGRFFSGGHSKRHDVMIRVFRRLCESGLRGWELHLAGSVHRDGPHAGYYEEMVRMADGLPVRFHPDASLAQLRSLYARSAIYWHAAGYGADPATDPAALEHFGITTVEAMGFGSVPAVFAGGGQLEIIEPGGNGLLWKSETELGESTMALAGDARLRRRLGEAARRSAAAYEPGRFRQRFLAALAPLLEELERGRAGVS